jgi:Tol biopolymer transport system component
VGRASAVALVLAGGWASFAACSSFNPGDPTADAGGPDASLDVDAAFEAAGDAGDSADAGDASTVCDPRGKFAPPALLPNLNTTFGEYGGRLTPDELTIYFASARPGGLGNFDLYSATRPNIAATFGTANHLKAPSSDDNDDYPSLSADGKELFFSRTAPDNSSTYEVRVARRATTTGDFGASVPVDSVNTVSSAEVSPFVVALGDLYVASDRRPGMGFDLHRFPVLPDGGFGTAEAILVLSTARSESAPTLSSDLLTIYFFSERTDGGGEVSGDIWVAHRSLPTMEFANAARVAEVSAPDATDVPTWLSPDNCRLYLSSNRSGRLQLYVASRER